MVFSSHISVVKKFAFITSLAMVACIALLYFYNMEIWAKQADYGYAGRSATGFDVIGVVTDAGLKGGLKAGDRILMINNKTFENITEIRAALNRQPGGRNEYLIDRDGKELDIVIENQPLGFARVFVKSGLNYLTGLCYIFIGILVFLMKPYYKASTVFYLFCATFGALLFFLYRVSELRPFWFGTVHIFLYAFSPAMFIHLALSFPERRSIIDQYPYLQVVPYVLSAVLFIGMRTGSPEMLGMPKFWYLLLMAYFVPSVLLYLLSCFYSWLRAKSAIARTRAKMILLGSAVTASLPLMDTIANAFFDLYLVPGFNYYLPFLLVFPIVIAYTIIKHNLFDIDAAIRRTFGYILATLGIALMYTLFVYVPTLFLGKPVSQSPVYLIIITVAILFFFSAIRSTIQKVIDRLYYRVDFDYQVAIRKISDKMRTLMKLDDIGKSIIDIITNVMHIDSGCVMLLDADNHFFRCFVVPQEVEKRHGDTKTEPILIPEFVDDEREMPVMLLRTEVGFNPPNLVNLQIPADEPILQKIAEKNELVSYYDLQENPSLQPDRELYEKFFRLVNATLVVPMVYEKQLTGLLALGRKKSGKFYNQEDISLLMTLANQAAVAVENARMVNQIIEKERMETRLMDTFGRYVSHEVRDQILGGNIPLDGEVKDVTVLFADLRDFTSLTETTPPKEIVNIINGYFTEMADSIRQHNGLVLQFIGDEIEAVFGAPASLDDHPTYAVKAALEMRERLKMVNAKLEKKNYRPLSHGIGIHTGSVVAANIGSADRMSYAMVGDTVNVASRIQGLSKELDTDILISETTQAMLSNDAVTVKLPAMKIKGKKEPVEVYKVA